MNFLNGTPFESLCIWRYVFFPRCSLKCITHKRASRQTMHVRSQAKKNYLAIYQWQCHGKRMQTNIWAVQLDALGMRTRGFGGLAGCPWYEDQRLRWSSRMPFDTKTRVRNRVRSDVQCETPNEDQMSSWRKEGREAMLHACITEFPHQISLCMVTILLFLLCRQWS